MHNRLGPLAESEQDLGQILDGAGVGLGEPPRFGDGPRLVGELGVGLAPPELQGGFECRTGVQGLLARAAQGDKVLEPLRVDGLGAQFVARCGSDKGVGADDLPESADRCSQRSGREFKAVSQEVGRHRRTCSQNEEAHQAALCRAGQLDVGAVRPDHPEGPEHLELHAPFPLANGYPTPGPEAH